VTVSFGSAAARTCLISVRMDAEQLSRDAFCPRYQISARCWRARRFVGKGEVRLARRSP
jgi:hypothetical protein